VTALTKVLRAAAESVSKRAAFTAWAHYSLHKAHMRRAAAAISTRRQLATKCKVGVLVWK
jgi:hypothetical protein